MSFQPAHDGRGDRLVSRSNPHLDVDRLVMKIQDEVALRELEGPQEPMRSDYARPPVDRTVRLLLATAEAKSAARLQWSSRLNVFPFTNARVQHVCLRLLSFLFKDQRHVNLSLIEATRELLKESEDLRSRIEALESRSPSGDLDRS